MSVVGRTEEGGTRILMIGGMGRSGSTLLSSLLGSFPGIVPLGELGAVWRAALINEHCSCGATFSECPFWIEVGESAFGGWHQVDLEEMRRINRDLVRPRHAPLYAISRFRRGRLRAAESYVQALERIYCAVHSLTGATVVVDSTHALGYVVSVAETSDLNVRLVHLIRDSRGVAFSWSRLVARPEFEEVPGHHGSLLGGIPPWKSAAEWTTNTFLFDLMAMAGTPRIVVHYESLVSQPVLELQRILALTELGEDAAQLPGLSEGEYDSKLLHTIGGNRARFLRGRVPLRLDDKWRTHMKVRDRSLVSALTFPLLVRHGYIGAGSSRVR